MKIANRTFIISGGASGLGLATARDLHAHGAYVSLLDLNSDAGAQIVSSLGSRAKFFEVDVSDTDAISKAIEGTVAWVKETGKQICGVIAVKARERDLMTAEEELEKQRAMMNSSVGGTNKDGVKFKIRERKR